MADEQNPQAVYSDKFEVPTIPTRQDALTTVARLAKFCNHFVAEFLKADIITAADPTAAALMQAAATLQQGAIQQNQIWQQQAGFAGAPMPPQRGPFGAN